jgi:hypothetical protein
MNYKKIYDQICERANKESRVKGVSNYYESHHIVPICLGGSGSVKEWATHENIVLLTAREHFLCHWLLHEMYPDNHKLAIAFNLMCKIQNNKQSRYKPSSRIIKYAKEIDRKARIGNTGFWKGKNLSEEVKEKLRLANIGKTQSKETLQKRHETKIANNSYKIQGDKRRGSKWSAETRAKVKLWHDTTGYKHSEEIKQKLKVPKKIVSCPHCDKLGGLPQMKQWHFDNCKSLKI